MEINVEGMRGRRRLEKSWTEPRIN